MPSIGKMAAQLTLDGQGFTAGLQKAQAELTKFGKENNAANAPIWLRDDDILRDREKGFNLGTKAIKGLGKAAGSLNIIMSDLAEGSTGAGKALIGFGQAAALAGSGNYILAAVFGLKALVEAFHTLNKQEDDISKAFDTIIEGTKSTEKAISDLRLEITKGGIKDLFKELRNLETFYESFIGKFVAASIGEFSLGLTGAAEHGLQEIANRAETQVKLFQHLLGLPAIQALIAEAKTARAVEQITSLREELALRGRAIGLTEDQIRLERIRRDLPQAREAGLGSFVGGFLAQFITGQALDPGRFGEGLLKQIEAIIKWQEAIKKSNEAFQAFAKEIRSQADALGTPFEKAEEQIANLNLAWELGIVDLEEYDQLIQGVLDKLDQATRIQQANAPGALAAGSQAAYSAFNTIQRQEMGGSQADRLLRAAEREAESQERTLNESRRTRQILEDRLPQLGLAR